MRPTEIGSLDADGAKVQAFERVPWNRLTAITIQAMRPRWAFAVTPHRVCVFAMEGAPTPTKKPGPWQRYGIRRSRQLYGTPLVLPEMLIGRGRACICGLVLQWSGLRVEKATDLPTKPTFLDLGLFGGVIGGIGVPRCRLRRSAERMVDRRCHLRGRRNCLRHRTAGLVANADTSFARA